MFGILQGLIDAINGAFGGLFANNGYSELMPGSSFHAVTAAFATQGYWIHADMLNFVGAGEFQRFAVFIYMIALISGMVGMAMGSPPKMYVWFFMGPVLFHFLLGTTSPVMGTAWKVAGVPQEQQEVWKLAEVGLKTMNITEREGLVVNGFAPPSGGVNGNGTVNISFAFAQLDGVVSDTIQEIIKWLGVYKGQSVGSTSGASSTGTGNDTSGRWHLLSNLKWGMLDTIAQARLSSPELRDSFITFMASSCGDRFQSGIDASRYMAASQSINGTIPPGVFMSGGVTAEQYQADLNKTYSEFNRKLNGTTTTPLAIRRLLYATKDNGGIDIPQPGSFRNALLAKDGVGEEVKFFKGVILPNGSPVPVAEFLTLDELLQSSGQIQCGHLLDIIVRGFRWEAAGVYTQLVRQLPVGVENPDQFDNAFLNGWDVRKYPKEVLFPATAGAKSWKQIIAEDKNPPKVETPEARRQFMINLILINMFKNEFLLAPNAAVRKLRFTSAQSAQNAIEMYQKTVGSRNKFGEIYSWALMMPYLQGLLLYLLALGYPFACAVMLLPRCSKIIFTWASFWVWAKLWDLGFAIVVLFERSVWATIGNSSKATQLNPFIAQMLDFGTTVWQGAGAGAKIPDATKLALVGFKDPANLKLSMNSYAFLDRSMTLFSNMDLDLQNSYYIYIMAALYFAVPMITGQLVLGAKASMAGSITQAFQGMANEVGKKAGDAMQANMTGNMQRAQALQNRAYALKAIEQGTLANGEKFDFSQGILGAQNTAARNNLNVGAMGAQATGLRNMQGMVDVGQRLGSRNLQYETEMASMLANPNTAIAFLANQAVRNNGQGLPTKRDLQNVVNGNPGNLHMTPAVAQGLLESEIWNGDSMDRGKLQAADAARISGGAPAGGASGSGAGGGQGGNPTGVVRSSPQGADHNSSGGFVGASGAGGGAGGQATPGQQFVGAGFFNGKAWVGNSMANFFGTGVDIDSKTGQFVIDSKTLNSQAMTQAQVGGLDQDMARARAYGELLGGAANRGTSMVNGLTQDSALDGQNNFFLEAANSGLLAVTNVNNSGQFNTEYGNLVGSGQLGKDQQARYLDLTWQGDNSKGIFGTHNQMFNAAGQAYGENRLLGAFRDSAEPWKLGNALGNANTEYKNNFATGANGGVATWGLDGGYNFATANGLGAPLATYGGADAKTRTDGVGAASLPAGADNRPRVDIPMARVDQGPKDEDKKPSK